MCAFYIEILSLKGVMVGEPLTMLSYKHDFQSWLGLGWGVGGME